MENREPRDQPGITRRRFLKRVGILGGTGLVAFYPFLIERYLVRVNHYRIPVNNLPDSFVGYKIVHLTDIHYGPLVPLWMIKRVVETINNLEKDVIVCTGDYVHEKNATTQIDAVWPVLAELEAPDGVYSVLGNHDHWADTKMSMEWLDQSRQNLVRRITSIEKKGQRIWLAGAGDFWEDRHPLDELLIRIPKEDCRILLAHNPDSADTFYTQRIDLMLSGHTHGGQVKIPFWGTPILPVQNKNYNSGLKISPKGTRVFISKGIGWAILPIRFNCYPEIAVLELFKSG
ncbi:metallophosphoesterase [Desulfobacterales bacterium HSG17]|nr:metallophosphoesterase [Desulfobacterales bacterium HSG17]